MAIRTHIGKQEETQEERSLQIRVDNPGIPEEDQVWLNTVEQRLKFFKNGTVQTVQAQAGNKTVISLTLTSFVLNYNVFGSDDVIYISNSLTSTITLPTAVGVAGKTYYIKARNGATPTTYLQIATTASQLVDGYNITTFPLRLTQPGQSLTLISDGTNWLTMGQKTERFQRKELTSDFSLPNTSITDLNFNNLEPQKTYRLSGQLTFSKSGVGSDGGNEFSVIISNGATAISNIVYDCLNATDQQTATLSFEITFSANDTYITFSVANFFTNQSIVSGSGKKTFAILEEKTNLVPTTVWT